MLQYVSHKSNSNIKSVNEILPNPKLLWVQLLSQLLLFSASLCIAYHYEVCSLSSSSIKIWLLSSNVLVWPLWVYQNGWFWAKYTVIVASSTLFFALTGKNVFTNVVDVDWRHIQTNNKNKKKKNKRNYSKYELWPRVDNNADNGYGPGHKMRGEVKPKSHIQEAIYLEVSWMSGQLFAVKESKCDKEGE